MAAPENTVTDLATRLVAALREELEKALDPQKPEPLPLRVGDTLDVSDLDRLPYGASFKDREGDIWFSDGDGDYAWSLEGLDDSSYTSLDPTEYTPLVITSLPGVEDEADDTDDRLADWERELLGEPTGHPVGTVCKLLPGAREALSAFTFGNYPETVQVTSPSRRSEREGFLQEVKALDGVNTGLLQVVPVRFLEPVPADDPIQVGDRVRVVDTRPFGEAANIDGKTGVVEAIFRDSYTVKIDADQGGYWAHPSSGAPSVGKVEKLPTEPEPAKAPTSATIRPPVGFGDIFVRRSAATNGARLEIRAGERRQSIHLDKAGTAELAATLQAIADQD